MDSFLELFNKLADNVNAAMLDTLAAELGVSVSSLQKLGVGYHPIKGAFAFPEQNARGDIIGISLRYANGKKSMVKGSKRGLYYEVNPDYSDKGNYYEPGKHNWVRVSKELPCPLCGKFDGCLVSSRNTADPPAIVCVHISKGAEKELELGFLHILKPEGKVSGGDNERPLCKSNLPAIVVEGYTDTAAAMDLGFVAVGRPSAEGGIGLLSDLLRGQETIIVGDNDEGVGEKGMETTFYTLKKVCPRIAKVLPPSQYKDLRQWKNQVALTQENFLKWVIDYGETKESSDLLEDDVAHAIAKTWLKDEKYQEGFPTIRCYKGQWIEYADGHYSNLDREELRGQLYRYLDGKMYPRITAKGETKLEPYRPTRSKINDIIDALSDWCIIANDPPTWLVNAKRPDVADLILFKNGMLDVNEYINGNIKLYDSTPELFNLNLLPYDFNPDAHSDIWEQECQEIFNGDEGHIRLLRQWFGYNCVPDMSMEKLMLFTGPPRSGKGTTLNALMTMLGREQCVSTSFQALSSEFGYQALLGKLSAVLSDAKVSTQRMTLSALEKVLQVVGGDPVGVSRKFLPMLPQAYLRCRFTVAMNELPSIPDYANALEPKISVLSFPNSYVGKEDTTRKMRICQDAKEGKLINFALEGLKDLRKTGQFVMPRKSMEILSQLRELTTPVVAFIRDCCELRPPGERKNNYLSVIDRLYNVWVGWCKLNGHNPGAKPQFGGWFLAACPSATPSRIMLNGHRHRVYVGVRLSEGALLEYGGE